MTADVITFLPLETNLPKPYKEWTVKSEESRERIF
jgi:hypothetical protein